MMIWTGALTLLAGSVVAGAAQLQLEAKTATIQGGAVFEQDKQCIGAWEDEQATVGWRIAVEQPGTVEITCIQAAEQRSAGNRYDVVIGDQRVTGTVEDTGAWDRFSAIPLGEIRVPAAGEYDVKVVPHRKTTLAVMNLRGLKLAGRDGFQATAILPVELQRGEYFHKKSYVPQALPRFADCRGQLPAPILDGQPEYVDLYWKCWELAFDHFKKPDPGSNGFISNYLDEAFNPNIFQWDTIFMVMFARYGHHAFPAVQSLDNFYAKQHHDGFICREIWETDGSDHHPKESPEAINPPLFSWAEVESYRVTGDKSRFALVLPVLEKYVAWLETHRRKEGTAHGLYWSNGLGSGMDNTPRGGSGWVDMSAQMVLQYRDLAVICEELGEREKAEAFRRRADEIAARINQWMWDDEDGLYYDVDDQGRHVKWKTAGCFWPMLAGVSAAAHEERLIENLRDPRSFWRQNVFPALAADQPGYDPSGGYWLGGVWAPTNYAIIRGLARQGHRDFAREASQRNLDQIYQVYRKTGTVWELYAPDMTRYGSGGGGMHGEHQARPDFVGWTGCGPIAMLIENVLGFEVDGARHRLRWELARTDRHGIANLRFGNATATLVCEARSDAAAPATIRIQTDHPFQLTIARHDREQQLEVPAGTTNVSF